MSTTEKIFRLASYFFPVHIATLHSQHNGKIRIEWALGGKRILVGPYIQSGEYAAQTLKHGLHDLALTPDTVKRILVLGVGGGSMLILLHKLYPKAAITGVDIDERMIEIARTYFSLSHPSIRTVVEDAVSFIKRKNVGQFDLIIDDLFVSCDRPQQANTVRFLRAIKDHLTPEGYYICNCSYLSRYVSDTDAYFALVQQAFRNTNGVLKRPNFIIRAWGKRG